MKAHRLIPILALVLCIAAPALAAPKLTLKTIKQSKGKIYKVDYEVLQIVSPTAAQAGINNRLMSDARKDVDAFIKQTLKDRGKDEPYTYDLSVGVHKDFVDDHWLSLSVRGGQFMGGAHPAPLLSSYFFDLKTGKALSLADLFKPGSPYLKVLAEKCRADLKSRKDEMLEDAEWRTKGTAPQKDNYLVFHIDGRNLVIVFPPYQVAPYAAGALEIKIPYADLADIARPGGPLAPK